MSEKFLPIIKQIAEERGLPEKKVVEIIETAIAAAFRKDTGRKGQIIKAEFNPKSGQMNIYQVKIIVDESMILSEDEEERREDSDSVDIEKRKIRFNPERHILIQDAKKLNVVKVGQEERESGQKFNLWLVQSEDQSKNSNQLEEKELSVGDEIRFLLEKPNDFGRIAAQTAKQVIIQRTREAEKETVIDALKNKIGEVVSGIVQRFDRGNIILDLNPGTGIIFPEEQIFNERYRSGQRIRALVIRVDEELREPTAVLSRSRGEFLKKLFKLEVPEINSGIVEIKSVAREAGSRSKIAVVSKDEKVDPIGACIGQRGTRVQSITAELSGEKIDIIQWDKDPIKFIANSLAPAKITEVKINEKEKKAAITAPNDQLSLAIGKKGQNVRLAVKLTGWKMDLFTYQGEKIGTEEIENIKSAEDTENTENTENKKENKEEKNEDSTRDDDL